MTQHNLFGGPPDNVVKAKPEPVLTTREISRLVKYYTANIRLHSVQETRGVFRQIQKLLESKDGRTTLTPQNVADAIKNYANDAFTKSLPQQRRKHIRSFFTYENVSVWMKPLAPRAKPQSALSQAMEQLETRKPAPIAQPPVVASSDESDEPVVF
jgi:hypothetical protein